MPPDFYLDPDDRKKNLMEIKAFNYKAGPGFDIADFRMYEQEIAQKPWMLDVTYLIFGYEMSDEGIVTIKKNMEETVYKNKDTQDDGPDWLSIVIDNYEKHYGVKLSVPRWNDIRKNYVVEK